MGNKEQEKQYMLFTTDELQIKYPNKRTLSILMCMQEGCNNRTSHHLMENGEYTAVSYCEEHVTSVDDAVVYYLQEIENEVEIW